MPSIDEPMPSVQVQSDNVECVMSEAPSAEASLSEVLYVTQGDRFEQLALSLLSQMRELRGLHPPVQSHPILGSGSQPIVAATDQLGVSAPLQGVNLPNPINPVFRLSTAPVSDETPVHRLATSDLTVQALEQNIAATHRAIDSLCDGGLAPPQSIVDSLSSLSRELVDAKRTSSELRGAICPLHRSLGFRLISNDSPLLRLSSQVLRNQKTTLHSLAHLLLGDDHTTFIHRIRLVTHFAGGVTLPPIRGVG